MLCANPKCRATLTTYQWGDGYCCKACMATAMRKGDRISDMLYDPSDPEGRRVIARTADEVDAMMEAMDVDPRLPRIVYRLRAGWSRRKVATAERCDEKTIRIILAKSAPNLLRRCGLRNF